MSLTETLRLRERTARADVSGGSDRAGGFGLLIMLELLCPLQIHQPRLAPADPEFIAWNDVARGEVQSAQHDLRLVVPQRGDARSAIGAKASAIERP